MKKDLGSLTTISDGILTVRLRSLVEVVMEQMGRLFDAISRLWGPPEVPD